MGKLKEVVFGLLALSLILAPMPISAQQPEKQASEIKIVGFSYEGQCVDPSYVQNQFGVQPLTIENLISPENFFTSMQSLQQKPSIIIDAEHMRFWIQVTSGCAEEVKIKKTKLARILEGFGDRFEHHFGGWEEFLAYLQQNGRAVVGSLAFLNLVGGTLGLGAIPFSIAAALSVWIGYNVVAFRRLAREDNYEEIGAMLFDQMSAVITTLGAYRAMPRSSFTKGMGKLERDAANHQLTRPWVESESKISSATMNKLLNDPDLPSMSGTRGQSHRVNIPAPENLPSTPQNSAGIITLPKPKADTKILNSAKPYQAKDPNVQVKDHILSLDEFLHMQPQTQMPTQIFLTPVLTQASQSKKEIEDYLTEEEFEIWDEFFCRRRIQAGGVIPFECLGILKRLYAQCKENPGAIDESLCTKIYLIMEMHFHHVVLPENALPKEVYQEPEEEFDYEGALSSLNTNSFDRNKHSNLKENVSGSSVEENYLNIAYYNMPALNKNDVIFHVGAGFSHLINNLRKNGYNRAFEFDYLFHNPDFIHDHLFSNKWDWRVVGDPRFMPFKDQSVKFITEDIFNDLLLSGHISPNKNVELIGLIFNEFHRILEVGAFISMKIPNNHSVFAPLRKLIFDYIKKGELEILAWPTNYGYKVFRKTSPKTIEKKLSSNLPIQAHWIKNDGLSKIDVNNIIKHYPQHPARILPPYLYQAPKKLGIEYKAKKMRPVSHYPNLNETIKAGEKYFELELDEILPLMNKSDIVVDFSSGNGELANYIMLEGFETYGYGPNYFKNNNLDLSAKPFLVSGYFDDLPFFNESIDLITAHHSLYIHKDIEALNEVLRVLKVGGQYVQISEEEIYEGNVVDYLEYLQDEGYVNFMYSINSNFFHVSKINELPRGLYGKYYSDIYYPNMTMGKKLYESNLKNSNIEREKPKLSYVVDMYGEFKELDKKDELQLLLGPYGIIEIDDHGDTGDEKNIKNSRCRNKSQNTEFEL